jgi:hypothetical protein
MKPFSFAFREYPQDEPCNLSTLEYSNDLNLNIDTLTGRPAIESLNMSTETFTKSQGEGSDSDKNGLNIMMETQTRTFTQSERPDNDANRFHGQLLMETATARSTMLESSDADI